MKPQVKIKKILIGGDPFGESNQLPEWERRGLWPASWISGAGLHNDRSFAYRNVFTVDESVTLRCHVTADACYRLFIDGELVGMGPESGDAANWFFDTWELTLAPGKHVIVAAVLSYGDFAPVAQVSVRHGFIFAAEGGFGDVLNTGTAGWQCRELSGLTLQKSPYWIFGYLGGVTRFDAREYPAGAEAGGGDGWQTPEVLYRGANADTCNEFRWPYLLRRSTLPPMTENAVRNWSVVQVSAGTDIFWNPDDALTDEVAAWQKLEQGITVAVPANTQRRVLVALPDYFCAYPYLTVSGGKEAALSLGWAEALFLENKQDGDKGDRGEWRYRYFIGLTDEFIADGGNERQFFVHRWKSGRYLMLTVATGAEALMINALELRETRYPLEVQSCFQAADERLNQLVAPCVRTLQMCSNTTFMDCPYYEQLMYIGDTRLQALLTYTVNRDTRLVSQSLRMFAASREGSGLLMSRYPGRVPQIIPGFSLLWIGMLHDFVYWRDDSQWGRGLFPVAKGIIDAFEPYRNAEGLIADLRSWNFVDWAENWPYGVPPGGENGISSIVNWLWCYAVELLADLCRLKNQPELTQFYHRQAQELAMTLIDKFWNDEKGLFADTVAHDVFSEHAQCLAVLSGLLPDYYRNRLKTTLPNTPGMTRATVYFSHYLFEACRQLHLDRMIFDRLQLWYDFRELHLQTLLERPEPSRSDCHAWSSHPLFHYFATVLGIRPGAPGFRSVTIEPHPGHLEWVKGTIPHPGGGDIKVSLNGSGNDLRAEIDLPSGVPGVFRYGGQVVKLHSGHNIISLALSPELVFV